MAYKITDACIACGACADACPVSAISEGDGKYEIDADTCIECGASANRGFHSGAYKHMTLPTKALF